MPQKLGYAFPPVLYIGVQYMCRMGRRPSSGFRLSRAASFKRPLLSVCLL